MINLTCMLSIATTVGKGLQHRSASIFQQRLSEKSSLSLRQEKGKTYQSPMADSRKRLTQKRPPFDREQDLRLISPARSIITGTSALHYITISSHAYVRNRCTPLSNLSLLTERAEMTKSSLSRIENTRKCSRALHMFSSSGTWDSL